MQAELFRKGKMRRKTKLSLLSAFLLTSALLYARQPALHLFRSFFLKDNLFCLPLTPGKTWLHEHAKFVCLNKPEISVYRSLCSIKRVKEQFPLRLHFKQIPSKLKIVGGQPLFRCNYLETEISFPFRHREKILMVAREYAGMKVKSFLCELRGGKFRKIKRIKYLFLSSSGTRFFTIKGKSRQVIILDENLQPGERLTFREGFVKEVFVRGNRVYIHRKRFCPGEAAVELYREGRLVRSFFYLHQSLSALPLEVGIVDDTVMALGERRIYVSFSYPLEGKIRIFTFSLEGEAQQIWEIGEIPGYSLTSGFFEEDKILESLKEEDLLAVNSMWEDGEELYIAVSHYISRLGVYENYLYVVNAEKGSFQKLKLGEKVPVFYDRREKTFYLFAVKGRTLKILSLRAVQP